MVTYLGKGWSSNLPSIGFSRVSRSHLQVLRREPLPALTLGEACEPLHVLDEVGLRRKVPCEFLRAVLARRGQPLLARPSHGRPGSGLLQQARDAPHDSLESG